MVEMSRGQGTHVAAAATGETPGAERDAHGRLRILLLEDSRADARMTEEALVDYGDGIDSDIAATLREVSAERLACVDCAVIDLGLPDASGLQALRRLRELAPTLPIVVLTGLDDGATGLSALRLGAQDYLVKQHADGYSISRAIRFAVERKRLQLALDHQALHDLDLHDDVIQRLFALGLAMQTTQRSSAEQPAVAGRISDHMNDLQQVVQKIRSTLEDRTSASEDENQDPPAH
jgi:DNA-binding response OmpR family regulator